MAMNVPSSKARLAIWELRNAVSSNPNTTNFRHLLPVNKRAVRRREGQAVIKTAPAKDRIKWWNIIPGDQVRVMADTTEPVREVLGVNKISNRVFLQSDKKEGRENTDPTKRKNPNKNVHYSGLQLFLGNYDFPAKDGSEQSQNLPVFAKRLGTSEPRWEGHRWVWDRFATATIPRLPTWKPGVQEHIPIPWPKTARPQPSDSTPYDTPSSVVAEVTYVPAKLPRKQEATLLRTSAPDDYVSMLRGVSKYDASIPFELLPARELSNPHSRAKKRARYLSSLARRRALLNKIVAEELANIGGRTRAAARADAVFKWREKVKAERKEEMKRRWSARGLEARLERRRERQKRNLANETRRLSKLVLAEKPNQFLPPGVQQVDTW